LQQIVGTHVVVNEITSIIKEVNNTKITANNNYKSASHLEIKNLGSPRQFDKQQRMNALKPTASGVLSSPNPNLQNSI